MLQKACIDCGKVLTGHGHAIRCKACSMRHSYVAKHGKSPMVSFVCPVCRKSVTTYGCNKKVTKSGEYCCSVRCKGLLQTRLAVARAPKKITSLCVICGEEKPVSEFYKDKKSRANGSVQYVCKECIKEQRKVYYDANVEDVNRCVRAYQKVNPGRHGSGYTPHRKQIASLGRAVRSGLVKKPKVCQNCEQEKWLHGHHWHGYDNPLDVIWLCPSCHHAAHGRGPKARAISQTSEIE